MLREIAVLALGEEHLAHAAFADELQELVRTDAPASEVLGFDVVVEQLIEQAAAVVREDR